MISEMTTAKKRKRPLCNRLARIYPATTENGHPTFRVSIGTGRGIRHEFYQIRALADARAAELNTPENLTAHFREFFDTEKELMQFLAMDGFVPGAAVIVDPEETLRAAEPPPRVELTARQAEKLGRSMKQHYRVGKNTEKKMPQYKAVVRWSEGGKYGRKYFATAGEAKAFADARNLEILQNGFEVMEMPTWLRGMAMKCQERLRKFNKTIADATQFYADHLERTMAAPPLSRVHAEWLTELRKKNRVHRYLLRCESVGVAMMRAWGPDTKVNLISARHIDQLVSELPGAPKTKNNFRGAISAMFGFAMLPRNGYVDKNPCDTVEAYEVDLPPPGVLTPEEFARLLEAARDTDLLPFFAIGGFAGVRVAEIQRMEWSEVDIDEGFIHVPARKSKTGMARNVKMEPCLKQWLEPFRTRKTGLVIPAMDFGAVRQAVIERSDRLRADPSARSLATEWPANALRHSYASYHIAHFAKAEVLALEMGHTTTDMIFKHYRRVVRDKDAARWWEITPAVPSNLVPMATPAEATTQPAKIAVAGA